MSTRCQIAFTVDASKKSLKDPEALVYRHSDGYPSGVLPDIMPFLKWFKGARGVNDAEYVSARLLQYLCNMYDGHSREMAKEYEHVRNEFSDKFTGTLGHGICKQWHWDIEYVYQISPEGVRVYDARIHYDNEEPLDITKCVKLIGKISFDDFESDKDYQKLIKR